jgi:hypothetical protein
MALTADEKALLDRLTAKAEQVEDGPIFDTIEKVVRYLVQTSDKFSANPEDRQKMLDYLDSVIDPPAASSEESENAEAH